MRSTAPMLRLTAQAVLLAFAGLLLVTLGCGGAQAATAAQASATHVYTAQFSPAALDNVVAPASPACIPGRDKVRLERDALPPTPAQLQPTRNDAGAGFAERAGTHSGAAPLLGRIPASLTHLDLGIVRT
ncbi:MAG: hypothetical protein ABI563_05495 [Specibacter sp.]